MSNLGWLYENGQGVTQDYTKAREWYQKAAEAGNTDAMINLGVMYGTGRGVTRDYGKARQWYQKAIEAGSTDAMNNLGLLYATARDYRKALEWFQKGADADNAKAMYSLGVLYRDAHGVARDYGKSREWFKRAADAGVVDAMTNLGVLYADAHDYINAREWFQKAADGGNTQAKEALLRLRKDTLTDQDPAQAAESNRQLSKPYVGRWERITAAGLRESYEFTSDGRCFFDYPATTLQGTYVEEAPGILHLKVKGKVILGEDNGVFDDTRLEYELKGSCLILTTENGSSDKFFPVR
jgi:TPR repeat protein